MGQCDKKRSTRCARGEHREVRRKPRRPMLTEGGQVPWAEVELVARQCALWAAAANSPRGILWYRGVGGRGGQPSAVTVPTAEDPIQMLMAKLSPDCTIIPGP